MKARKNYCRSERRKGNQPAEGMPEETGGLTDRDRMEGRARARLQRDGVELGNVVVHQDQDGVYTGHQWLWQLRIKDRVRVSYSVNGARGNTAMESFNGHFKAENGSPLWVRGIWLAS